MRGVVAPRKLLAECVKFLLVVNYVEFFLFCKGFNRRLQWFFSCDCVCRVVVYCKFFLLRIPLACKIM